MLHVAGNIDTGDFVVVPLGNGQDILLRLMLGHWQGGVDMDLVDGGNLVQHHLEGFQVGEGFPPSEHKVAIGYDGLHPPNASADLFGGKNRQVRILPFFDIEKAVVLAVIGNKDRHRCALPRLICYRDVSFQRLLLVDFGTPTARNGSRRSGMGK